MLVYLCLFVLLSLMSHIVYICLMIFEQINDDDDDEDDLTYCFPRIQTKQFNRNPSFLFLQPRLLHPTLRSRNHFLFIFLFLANF